jgi:hypothetical protein
MQRAKIRRWVLVIVVALAAASMFPSLGGSSHHRTVPPPHKPVAAISQPHGNVHTNGREK